MEYIAWFANTFFYSMNISYEWLKDLIDVELNAEELAEKMTLVGLELDGMHKVGEDYVLDIEVTSNRGDCLSHLGVAREISAFSDKEIKFKDVEHRDADTAPDDLVKIEAPDLCHRFTARIIKGVEIGPSPEWIVNRLEAIGERSINNVADITNYVMHELGQPMHAFDFDKLGEKRIVVRKANPGEKITTLDEEQRKLDPSMLVICDAVKPVAVGGVMGGIDSGITEGTTNVLLEVAYFDRENIRRTSRKLGLSSEASYHFERGVDINNLVRASNRATQLICELAGGTVGPFADVYPTPFEARKIATENLRAEVKRLSGLDVAESEILRILTRLGLTKLDETTFQSPSWRHDLAIEEDLVEEVVRVTGYDKVSAELPSAIAAGEYQPTEERKRRLRETLSNFGFHEALSYSFIDSGLDQTFDVLPGIFDEGTEEFVTIKDPIIEGATRMRPSLLSGMLDAVKANFNQQNKNLRLFEIGKVFGKSNSEDGLPIETELMGILVTGDETIANKALTSTPLDFYDLKGALEAALESIGSPTPRYEAKNLTHLQAGQSGEIVLAGETVGFIGMLSSEIAAKRKFKQPVFLAEVNLQRIMESDQVLTSYSPLPVYPGITRDVSMVIDRDITFDNIKEEISKLGIELCRRVEFVDVFEGKGLADDKRSLTIRIEYRSDERTLVEEEVEKVHQDIINALKVNLAIEQR